MFPAATPRRHPAPSTRSISAMKQETFEMISRQHSAPTHANITHYLSAFLPPRPNDVAFLYHTPRHHAYDPTRTLASHVILSVTPTRGVYTALDQSDHAEPPVCFLHRPWALDRRAVPRGSLVVASHASLDMYLTVGWNVTLAGLLGLHTESALCVQGYKGDPERRIGIIARVRNLRASLGDMAEAVRREFAGAGDVHVPAGSGIRDDSSVTVVAIMNAFHPEEVDRVLAAAHAEGWISDSSNGAEVLYLTGAARDYGLEAAAIANMPVICVGHRACEEWAIRYLAEKVREQWPDLTVTEVLEEEDPRPGKNKVERLQQGVSVSPNTVVV